MSLKVTSNFPLTQCPDCESEHIGGPCGMSPVQRFRSVRLGTDWMPAKNRSRELGHTEYYDDDSLKETFGDGLTGNERKEQMMEETQGVGYATAEDIEKYPDLVYEHFLNNPKDEVS